MKKKTKKKEVKYWDSKKVEDQKIPDPKLPKLKSPYHMDPSVAVNKRGQMVIIGIFILIMAVIVFIATLPAMSSILDIPRGCSYLNCNGYVDKDATTAGACTSTNQSYVAAYDENELGCTVLDLALPLLILAVILGLITKLIHGKLTEEPTQYPGY